MDQDAELAKFKWMLIAGVGFLITGYFSLQELRYALFSKTVDATITQIREKTVSGRRGRTHQELAFEYQFKEVEGPVRNERDDVSVDWPRPGNGTIAIQYIPGVEKASRLLGHSNMFAVYGFMACIAGLAFAGYKLVRLANEPPKSYGKRRSK
ncbi:MAG: hypothetical protein JWM11_19 [Planctomycetaceae bacterium]|nr:hypothetical protein [Planctomycetaceae bacterium]